MTEDKYYIGSDLKFQIDISATGFDQNRDDYEIKIYCGDQEIVYTQDNVISHEGKFYLPVPTDSLQPGLLKMVITAYVPDDDFASGYRKEIAVRNLKYLKKIL